MSGYHEHWVLDCLAIQLKAGRIAACRRVVQRILAVIKRNYGDGKYESRTEVENKFGKLVECEES